MPPRRSERTALARIEAVKAAVHDHGQSRCVWDASRPRRGASFRRGDLPAGRPKRLIRAARRERGPLITSPAGMHAAITRCSAGVSVMPGHTPGHADAERPQVRRPLDFGHLDHVRPQHDWRSVIQSGIATSPLIEASADESRHATISVFMILDRVPGRTKLRAPSRSRRPALIPPSPRASPCATRR